jgi:hypothetical protein
MAIIACARRKTDGLLTWAQTSQQAPDKNAIIQKGVDSFGGVAADWEYRELSDEQAPLVLAGMPGRAFMADDDGITSVTVPRTPTISVDKGQIEDDGVDEATISFDTTDGTFTGDVSFKISVAGDEAQTIVKAAVAGVATLTVSTLLTGKIYIDARVESIGDGHIEVEGI